jgi:GrpB-like predicted nucleotidyltransferase (UPF0157 family)
MESESNIDISHATIETYNPAWIEKFEQEAERLKEVLGDDLLGVEHIGSTSVPGLPAKPIIDIMVLVADPETADRMIPKLQDIGYPFDIELHRRTQFPERHLFRKGHPTKFHLSIAYANNGSFWKRQLAFRDYLKEHPEERDRYAELKRQLIEKDPTGQNTYIGGKTDLINEMLDKSGFVRWKPPTT